MTPLRLARLLAAAGLVVLMVTACDKDSPPPAGSPTPGTTVTGAGTGTGSATPTASASATPSPTPPPTDAAIVFAADGIGPYIIGTQLSDLQSRSQVTGVFESQLCSDSQGATATGRYAGQINLTFTSGKLSAIHTTSPALVTPSGAKVGMTLADAQSLYGSRGTLITGTPGNKALVIRVPASTLAVVLYLDPANTKVASMSGGVADKLESAARTGEGC